MARILFRAHDASGDTVMDAVDAGTAEEALAALAARGMANIRLQDTADLAALRDDRAATRPAMHPPHAAFDLDSPLAPGMRTFLRELFRRLRLLLGLEAILLLCGLAGGARALVLLALGLLCLTLVPPLWQYRHAMRYDRLLRAWALGEWQLARHLVGLLAAHRRKPSVAFDLAARAAGLRAVEGELAAALAALESWRPQLESVPGAVDQRIAAVCHAAGDYPGFVAAARRALDAAPDNVTYRLDLALAEARVGNVDAVPALMAGVEVRKVPSFGRPFIDWVRGMVALRHGRPESVQALGAATQGFLEYAANPAVWTSLALCSGAYALALAQNGRVEEARATARHVWPVLRVHGDRMLLTLLKRELQGIQR